MPNDPLGIRDCLDSSSDAAKHTRTMTIVLTVASVLTLVALLNSMQSQWMHNRMLTMGDIHGPYIQSKIGPYPQPKNYPGEEYNAQVKRYEARYLELCSAVEKAYVEGSLVVRVPFLGFTFDINDLGLIAGAGFLIILGAYRFFISREVDNLRISFDEARKIGKRELAEFYTLLAMRQVFTVPRTRHLARSVFLVLAPKALVWSPMVIYIAVTIHDIVTAWIGKGLSNGRFQVLIGSEVVIAIAMFWLSISVTKRLLRMDGEWNARWDEIEKWKKPQEASEVRIEIKLESLIAGPSQ